MSSVRATASALEDSSRKVHDGDVVSCEFGEDKEHPEAEHVFQTRGEHYESLSRQHGGHWRYSFVDHAYLYNPYFPPASLLKQLRDCLGDLIKHYPAGQDTLGRFAGTLIEQPPERIVMGNGACELIKIIVGQLCRRLIVPVPTFNEYENAVPRRRLIRFPLEPFTFQLDVDRFAAKVIESNADVAVVVTPNNPTSLLVPKSELLRLAAKLADHRCILLVDESFVDFAAEGASLEPEIGQHPKVAVLKSLGKAYGISGLRLGYLLTANREFAEAVRKKVHIWNINSVAQAFLQLAPQFRREFAASCDRVRSDRDDLYGRLCSIPGTTAYKPDGNFVFCRVPDGSARVTQLAEELLFEHNILIRPCTHKTLPDSDRYVRVGSRTRSENQELIEALKHVFSMLSGSQVRSGRDDPFSADKRMLCSINS